MHGMRSADRVGRRLGQAEEAHLALVDEPRHRADRVLDRHGRIDAMLVVEVDRVDPQPLQRRLAGLPHVVGMPADAEALAVRAAPVAELRRDDDPIAAPVDRAADELLVDEGAVHVGRVEQRHAEVDGATDRRHRLILVGLAVELRHPHAAEADRGDRGAAASEHTCLHRSSCPAARGRPTLRRREVAQVRGRPRFVGGATT